MRIGKSWVLCVDDDHDTCEILKIYCSDWKVRTAASAAQALVSAQRRTFNLYLLDNWLPDEDGIELCRKIRQFDPNTPIMFYSAAAYSGDREQAIAAGAQEYVVKPADPQFLKQRAESLMTRADLRDLEARSIELAALSENVLIPRMPDGGSRSQARLERSGRRHAARVTAYLHYTNAGGSRANFERFWTEYQNANKFSPQERSKRTESLRPCPSQTVGGRHHQPER